MLGLIGLGLLVLAVAYGFQTRPRRPITRPGLLERRPDGSRLPRWGNTAGATGAHQQGLR